YSWYQEKTGSCIYVAALMRLTENYLQKHNIGDATDMRGSRLLSVFREKRTNSLRLELDTKEQQEKLSLVPRLAKKEDGLAVSFKVGTKKLFVVKKLDDFCRNVNNSAVDVYGSSTEINHDIDNFTEDGRNWIRFISSIVQEEEKFLQKLQEDRYYSGYQKSSVGAALNLFGWRLDRFYETLGDGLVEYEDKTNPAKKKETLCCGEGKPKLQVTISENKIQGQKEFHGIQVDGVLPELFAGGNTSYYVEDGALKRVDGEFTKKLDPLMRLGNHRGFSVQVGRHGLAEFYHKVLPQLQEIAEVTEIDPEKFQSYLPPEANFTFYLDADEKIATCRLHAGYGSREVSVLDLANPTKKENLEGFRERAGEEEMLYQAMRWFPYIDLEGDQLHTGEEEENIYRLMEQGVDSLLELGEVRCTNRFRNRQVIRRARVSVGVSVSSGLLNLDIATEDISREELLDILGSYRMKKKYYRMKSGEFVDLEDDSLKMLSEMMETMHISSKEFLKGNIHLPAYRTLYLDKLLEENDSVYSSRDSHFRSMVKGFKTVSDGDFEVPKSLSRIMRKYQKNGYQWLRTLESWKFGGILADDMGLGKTLQVIAVLLAAHLEKKEGTSLVVAPASLVFNWGEELHRFAPQLAVALVTGTQEERKAILENSGSVEVLVTSYDLLKRDIALYEDKMFLYEIIDEAQYIKNHTTAAAKSVKVIQSRIRYALTGTPIENRLSELWSIFDYLMPGFLYSYEIFKKEIEQPIVKSEDADALKRLQKMTGPFILRRLKEQVLKDLPAKLEEVRYVKFDQAQQRLYDGQLVHMKENIASQNAEEFNKNRLRLLAELTRLRQICCDPMLCFEDYKGEAAKVEACVELVQSAIDGGHRILLFSQFTSMLEILQRRLDQEKIDYFKIIGDTPKEQRIQLVNRFNQCLVPVFLISLKAGGVGLNLTGADVVIHYDPWWNLAAQN
ncbi:MAG: SNF2 helicase associated domain-containing protein, partial [Lachnospiraceae bacterium]|nr:SNF2 helicase associated domain-containing protein [Lachnospiraceae bacterium]